MMNRHGAELYAAIFYILLQGNLTVAATDFRLEAISVNVIMKRNSF